jgi:hypothetical protein
MSRAAVRDCQSDCSGERTDDRMERLARDRAKLRLEQCRDEEGMVRQLDGLYSTIVGQGRNDQTVAGEQLDVRGREPEVAPVEADERSAAIQRPQLRPDYRGDVALLSDKTARETIDH